MTALHIASYKNMINTLEMMLTAPGADVDIKDEVSYDSLVYLFLPSLGTSHSGG